MGRARGFGTKPAAWKRLRDQRPPRSPFGTPSDAAASIDLMRQLTRALIAERARQGETEAEIKAQQRLRKYPQIPPFYTVVEVHDNAGITVEGDWQGGQRRYHLAVAEAAQGNVPNGMITIYDSESPIDELARLVCKGVRHVEIDL